MTKSVLILIVLLFGTMVLTAHPASNVNAVFDMKTAVLKVDFTHKVDNESAHFIYDIVVKINGKQAVKQELLKQDNKEGGSVLYKVIDAKVGDKIQIVTDCNKGGKKSETLTVK